MRNTVRSVLAKLYYDLKAVKKRFQLRCLSLTPCTEESCACEQTAAEDLLSVYTPPCRFTLPEQTLAEERTFDVSVVIPVYNDEQFIEECLESVLRQSRDYRIEIICVDDGSTDRTPAILDRYAAERGVQVIHQENAGISAARNAGIERSRGKYLLFVDDDDVLDGAFVEKMLGRAISDDADYVKCGYSILRDGVVSKVVVEKKPDREGNIMAYNGYVWGSLIRAELFRQVRFPRGFWYEDMITRLLLFPRCRRFSYVPEPLYTHRMHSRNASSVLWHARNPKSLDQLYLARDCFEMAAHVPDIEITRDYCAAVQYELSAMLFQRTYGLNEDVRKRAFLCAAELNARMTEACPDFGTDRTTAVRLLNEAFSRKNFSRWEKISRLMP